MPQGDLGCPGADTLEAAQQKVKGLVNVFPAALREVPHSPVALKIQHRHDEDRQDDETSVITSIPPMTVPTAPTTD